MTTARDVRKELERELPDAYEISGIKGVGEIVLTAESARFLLDLVKGVADSEPEWHRAEAGQVWDLETTQGTTLRAFVTQEEGEAPVFVMTDSGWYDPTDPVFIGGERLL